MAQQATPAPSGDAAGAPKKAPAATGTPATTPKKVAASGAATTPAEGGASTAPVTLADAPGSAGTATATIRDVIVTTRLREEELQEVPVPVTAVTGETLDREQQQTIKEFAQKVPSLTVTAPNPRNTSIAIRGIGKTYASDALEASVGVIVDGVVATIPGQTWGDYGDLQQIEVARGPQGTLLGKNTTLGALNITTKAPTFEPEREVEVTVGSRDLFITKATASGPVFEDKLAYRASVYFDRQDGFIDNTLNDTSYNGQNRWGGKLQFLYTPNADVTNRTIIDHSESKEQTLVLQRLSDPQFFTDTGTTRNINDPDPKKSIYTYTTRLKNWNITPTYDPFNSVELNDQKPVYSSGNGISTQTDWKLESGYTLTSITAYRDYHFSALNDQDYSRLSVASAGYLVDSWQGSQELRLTSPKNVDVLGQKFDYTAGLYALRSEVTSTLRTNFGKDAGQFFANLPVSPGPITDSLNGVNVRQTEKPETTSLAAYGQATWHVTSAADLTLGLRNTYEEKENSTRKWYFGAADLAVYQGTPLAAYLPAAKNIRDNVTRLFYTNQWIKGDTIYSDSWSWLINPSYKFTDNILGYVSASFGEKSGAVQFDQNLGGGTPLNVEPEEVHDYEVGLKTTFFDKKLTLNPNLYYTEITNYQALLGKNAYPFPIAYLGNVPGVRLRGVEIEGSYETPIDGLKFTFAGAYNDAIYTDFKNAPAPGDLSASYDTTKTYDLTNKRLAGAARWSGNIGASYSRSVWDGYTGYVWVSEALRSGAYLDTSLSKLAWQEGFGITNIGIGITPDDKAWDLSLWSKNLFDKQYFTAITSVSQQGASTGSVGDPRVIGVTLRAKL